ncbi:hypothetical protein BCR39DRAFT_161498 [Naematelia encephala]|uniref:BHLH domain-containing protein n=1 Tax=Naematelia encephala TaxID=71784 RepID=A0A1Y2B6M2_9TREE|nr:hypothetical protein BCR39DRAFT_161498 [Naematelia encephala]
MNSSLSPFSGSPSSIKNETIIDNTAMPRVVPSMAKPPSKSKPRKRVNTAEKRHQHNAIERQRRETLNGKFLSLARLLPALASHRRPSKSAIVNGSISHLTHQRDQRLMAARLLRKMCAEHDELLNEVNEWRKANGFPAKESAPAWTDEVEDVCSVEKEVFGNFASMGGDDDGDDDGADAEADAGEVSLDLNTMQFNGLVTPRSSTQLDSMVQPQDMFADKRQAGVNGLNWSTDFAFNVANGGNASVSSTNSLPFNGFLGSSDGASSTSPANSHSGPVLTPPTTADLGIYTHTPSPRSSAAGEEINKPAPTQSWSAQQLLFMQSNALGQRPNQAPVTFPTQVNPASNPAYGLFAHTAHQAQLQGLNQPAFGTDAFTQSLLSSMFPTNSGSAAQVQEWRKVALAGVEGF